MSERDDLARDQAEKRPPLATRAVAPTPLRLSRKALATLADVSAIGVAAALGYSLTASRRTQDHQETVSVERRNTDAPKDYGDLARPASAGIGAPSTTPEAVNTPPLSGRSAASTGTANNEASAEQQRRRQQRDSARASKLFAGTSERARSATASAEPPPPPPGQRD